MVDNYILILMSMAAHENVHLDSQLWNFMASHHFVIAPFLLCLQYRILSFLLRKYSESMASHAKIQKNIQRCSIKT